MELHDSILEGYRMTIGWGKAVKISALPFVLPSPTIPVAPTIAGSLPKPPLPLGPAPIAPAPFPGADFHAAISAATQNTVVPTPLHNTVGNYPAPMPVGLPPSNPSVTAVPAPARSGGKWDAAPQEVVRLIPTCRSIGC